MHRGREARLDRLIRRGGEGNRAAVERHRLLLTHAAIGAAIRESLARSGIDPGRAAALRIADEASAELAASGDPPPWLCAARAGGEHDSSDAPESLADAESRFDDRMGRLVARCRDDPPTEPDFARASLAELFAWCIAAADRTRST
jgi:hypothetical protein